MPHRFQRSGTAKKPLQKFVSQLFGKADKTLKTANHGDNYYQTTIFGKHTNSLNKGVNETLQERDKVKTKNIM